MLNYYFRLFEDEVRHSSHLNQWLGVGVGLFQGLSNMALNGSCLYHCMTVHVCVRGQVSCHVVAYATHY